MGAPMGIEHHGPADRLQARQGKPGDHHMGILMRLVGRVLRMAAPLPDHNPINDGTTR